MSPASPAVFSSHPDLLGPQGLGIASLPPDICLDRDLPYVHIPRDRRYASITFDIDSGLYVAGALFDTTFLSFDEEGEPAFVPDCNLLSFNI